MNESLPEAYFVDGGTLLASTPSYVKRPADDELFDALIKREYCYVLTPRQMGKSSLMIRTARRLKDQNIQTAVVDIQGIGTVKNSEWYASMLSQIRRGLKLSVDIDEWMAKKRNVSFGQLFSDFIQDIVLTTINSPIVIFFDEVDYMIKIDFRDDFFASIRAMYNARAQYPEFNRISFVLLGVASPADLISEPTRTPFNIGHAIPLQEFSLEDATPLQVGLEQVCPGQGKRILDRIFYWTSGHPYLTQKICKTVAEAEKADWSNSEVDDLVDHLFLREEAHKEANLKFIQERILSNDQIAQLLRLYKRVRNANIKENGQSTLQNQLMLSGLLASRGGYLEIRNRIYRTVFNERWIDQNTPKHWRRRSLIALLGAITALLSIVFINDATVGFRSNRYAIAFNAATTPSERLSNLANIYRLKPILYQANTSNTASQLFYGLRREEQLSMFSDYPVGRDQKLQNDNDLVTVVSRLYITLGYVDPNNDNTELLQTMSDALQRVKDNTETDNLKEEINGWLLGRQAYRNQIYETALAKYSEAIGRNSKNPATLYERALVYLDLASGKGSSENYINALKDLDTVVSLAKESTQPSEIELTPVALTTILSTQAPSTNISSISTSIPTKLSTQTATIELTKNPRATRLPDVLTPSPQSTLSTATSTPEIDRFESHFSTYIEIVSAVRTLIDESTELQAAIQPTGGVTYANLQSAGLVRNYPTSVSPSACDQAQFIADVTVPDGTIFAPGTSFTKTWRLKNVGSCEWTTSYQLVFSSGTQMSAPSFMAFPTNVAAGKTVELSVNMKAPIEAGHYMGYWMLRNANGGLFGVGAQANKPWWVDINVNGPSSTSITYDFTADADSAVWSSGAGELSFPGTDGDEKGFALQLEKPDFEDGVIASQPGLLFSPQQVTDGFIQAEYPEFTVQDGDHFKAKTGCQVSAISCYVTYRLDYQIGDSIRTLWNSRQRFEGFTYDVNLDLSPLAGQNVRFILYISAYGSPVGDRALWGNPVIVRSEASTSRPAVTPGGPTITPSPNIAYDFATNACTGTWFNSAGQLPCPGTDGAEEGFVLKVSNPKLENGDIETQPSLLTFPQNTRNGYIQGVFPSFEVQSGDRFRSIVNCEDDATNCYVAFRLDYQVGSDPTIRAFWGPFLERYEGKYDSVDVDLSPLAGKDVKFILTVLSAGVATGDRALWVGPIIYRAGGSFLPTPTPK